VDALEDQVGAVVADDRGSGESACPNVLDDRDLLVGDVPPSVAPEHRVLVQRIHVGVPSPSEERAAFFVR
jgi:hypothetical protein